MGKQKITFYVKDENMEVLGMIKHKSKFLNKIIEQNEGYKALREKYNLKESLEDIFLIGVKFLEYKRILELQRKT